MLTTLDISKSTGSDGVGIEPEVVFENSVFRCVGMFAWLGASFSAGKRDGQLIPSSVLL